MRPMCGRIFLWLEPKADLLSAARSLIISYPGREAVPLHHAKENTRSKASAGRGICTGFPWLISGEAQRGGFDCIVQTARRGADPSTQGCPFGLFRMSALKAGNDTVKSPGIFMKKGGAIRFFCCRTLRRPASVLLYKTWKSRDPTINDLLKLR